MEVTVSSTWRCHISERITSMWTRSLPREVYTTLTALDDRLVEALERGDIKLLRSAWLRTHSDESRLLKRQDLEALGAGGVSPLLSPAEAVELLRKGKRAVGVTSHGWLTPGNPDPAGVRLRLLRQELRERPYIEAVFFDFASLYQQPRDQKQNEAFQRALGASPQTPLDELPRLGLSVLYARTAHADARSNTRALPPVALARSRHGRPLRLGHRHDGPADQGDPAAPRRVRRRSSRSLASR